MDLTDRVKARAQELGADLVGVAPVERFAGAPRRMSPQGLLPGAKSVIVAAIHHPDAAVELGGEPTAHDVGPYGLQSWAMNPKLDHISFLLARFLEGEGHRTLPIAASNVWRYRGYKDLKVDFAPDLAHRYAAVAAGLGEIGWSGLCLTPEFGPRQRFVSIVTEAHLRPTPMYDGEPLCDRCMECVKNCPTDAFRKEAKLDHAIEIGGRAFQFPLTNKWRCAWAENFNLSLALPIPEKVDEKVILEHLEKHGFRGGEEGSCLKFCMVPERRVWDPSYCRAPRRRKQKTAAGPAQLVGRIKAVFEGSGLDLMAIGEEADLAGSAVHPRYHLPDARWVICLGMLRNAEPDHSPVRQAALRRLHAAAFDVAHALDLNGHSALVGSNIADELVALTLGAWEAHADFATVLTSAPLARASARRRQAPGRLTAEGLLTFCRDLGADLTGFFGVERFEALRQALKGVMPARTERDIVQDKGLIYGPWVPEVKHAELTLKGPEDRLAGARSVIVLGLHFPDAALDTAKTTPAETTGPFAFVQYESLRQLERIGFGVMRRLKDAGYRATFTFDLAGLASETMNPRGMLPDMRGNLLASILAGLAYPGLHGCPLTPQYGVRQRFLAIVTDMPLPGDALYEGKTACESCARPCLEACPTSALDGATLPVTIEGRELRLPHVDGGRCDWAKRYCLAGREGPSYCGISVDLPPPEPITGAEIVSAVSGVQWGVQKRLISIAEECVRVCPAHRENAPAGGGSA